MGTADRIHTLFCTLLLLLLFASFLASWPLMALFIPRSHAQNTFFADSGIHCATCRVLCARNMEACVSAKCLGYRGDKRDMTLYQMDRLERCWGMEQGRDEWGAVLKTQQQQG